MNTVSTTVSSVSASSFASFYRVVYGKMTYGLALTALFAWVSLNVPAVQQAVFGNRMTFYGLLFAEFALVIWLSTAIRRLTSAQAMTLFSIYAALNGVTMSAVLSIYTGTSVVSTFVVTSGTFGVMSLYGALTKRDLSSWGSFLMMGLVGVLIASVVNLFFMNSMIYWVSTFIGVIVFTGLAAYDNFKLKHMAAAAGENSHAISAASTVGALQLYLDFINLFLFALRILGIGAKK